MQCEQTTVLLLPKNVRIKMQTGTCTSLPLVYMGVTLGLTLQEGQRLKVPENRVLRYISEPRKKEVTGDSRKMHSEELHDLYCSPNIIWVIK